MRRRALLAASAAQGGESEWAFTFHVYGEYGWTSDSATQHEKELYAQCFALLDKYMRQATGGEGGDATLPPEFDIRYNDIRVPQVYVDSDFEDYYLNTPYGETPLIFGVFSKDRGSLAIA